MDNRPDIIMKTCSRCKLPQDNNDEKVCQFCGFKLETDSPKPIKSEKRSTTLKSILSWSFGGLLLLTGIFSLTDYPFIGILYALMACLLIPPIIKNIEKSLNYHIKTPVKIFLFVVLLFLTGIFIPDTPQKTKDSKPIETIEEKNISEPIKNNKSIDCWELGFKIGYCSGLSLNGYECAPEDDIILPAICRNEKITDMGMKRGLESAYDKLGIPH